MDRNAEADRAILAILSTPDVEGLPPPGVSGIPGVMLLGGETDPARIAAAILDHTPNLSAFDRATLNKEKLR